ncbi:MAG TPA: GAF domain-containing protein, partial [Allocoleopsis sp.]
MASATLTQCINRIWAIANQLQETQQDAAALELHNCLETLADVQQQQHAEAQERHELEQALHKSLLCNRLAFSIATSRIYGLSFDRIVESVLQQIHSAFPNWRVAYSTIDAEGQLAVIQSLQPAGMPCLTGLSVDLTLAPEYLAALRRGEPVIIEDVADASSISPIAEVMLAGGTQAVLDLPLKPSRQLVGLLCLDSPQAYCWNEHEIGAMIEIADYLSYALQEVHTQRERQKAEALLYQANRELQQYATQLEAANQGVEITLEELRQGNEELMVAHQDTEWQQQRYQDLFNFAPDAYLVTNAWGMIQQANQAARRLLGASHDIQILGKPLSQFVPLDERRVFRTQLNQLSHVHQPIQFEINLQLRQGRRGDGEMGRWGDGETGRWGDGETGRWGDGAMFLLSLRAIAHGN